MERFSKKTLALRLEQHAAYLEREYHFDPSNGYAQCFPRNSTEAERTLVIRAYYYGRYDHACDLLQDIDPKGKIRDAAEQVQP